MHRPLLHRNNPVRSPGHCAARRPGDRPDDATAGRRVGGVRLALVALLVLVLSGCGAVAAAADLSATLVADGFPDANVTLNSTNGVDTVQVTTGAHPTLTGEAAFDAIATTVWTELPRRFDQLDLIVGTETAGIDREGLEVRFGPRDPALDEATIAGDVTGALGTVGVVLLAVVVLITLLIVLLDRPSTAARRVPAAERRPRPVPVVARRRVAAEAAGSLTRLPSAPTSRAEREGSDTRQRNTRLMTPNS